MQNNNLADYLALLDSQREAILIEIKAFDSDLLWLRPAEKEWSMGENIEHGRVLLKSFRRLLNIIWPIFSPYAKLKRRRHYEVTSDNVYERPGFPLNVGWIWPSKYNADNPFDQLNSIVKSNSRCYLKMDKVSISDKLKLVNEHWKPKVLTTTSRAKTSSE